jgi:hypothetical protein
MNKNKGNQMYKKFVIIGAIAAWSLSSIAVAQEDWVAKKKVRLTCSTLPYDFDCMIPLVQDPQFSSRCFYVAEGQSTDPFNVLQRFDCVPDPTKAAVLAEFADTPTA